MNNRDLVLKAVIELFVRRDVSAIFFRLRRF
jgi:hypothetical protein